MAIPPIIPQISSFLKASSLGQAAPSSQVGFSSLVQGAVQETLKISRERDQAVENYMAGKATVMEVTQKVQQAKLDWMAFQKVSEATLKAFNDLVYKTGM